MSFLNNRLPKSLSYHRNSETTVRKIFPSKIEEESKIQRKGFMSKSQERRIIDSNLRLKNLSGKFSSKNNSNQPKNKNINPDLNLNELVLNLFQKNLNAVDDEITEKLPYKDKKRTSDNQTPESFIKKKDEKGFKRKKQRFQTSNLKQESVLIKEGLLRNLFLNHEDEEYNNFRTMKDKKAKFSNPQTPVEFLLQSSTEELHNNFSFDGSKILIDNKSEGSRQPQYRTRSLIKLENLNESEDLDDEDHIHSNEITFSNRSHFKFIWDCIILFFILYSMIVIPYNLAFNINAGFLEGFEILIDSIFLIDIIFNFFTSYLDDEDNLVKSRYFIAKKYIKGYLLLDTITLIPFQYILTKFYNSNHHLLITSAQWLKVCRLIKISQYTEESKPLSKVNFVENVKLNRILKSSFLLIILVHISSCIWIYIAELNSQINWIVNLQVSGLPKFEIYIASLYYQLVTIYTIGYGDIVCTNLIERLYSCLLLMVGVMTFSFAVSTLSTLFGETDKKTQIYEEKISELESLKITYGIGNELFAKINQSLMIQYLTDQNEKLNFLQQLPKKQRQDLMILMYKQQIKNLNFFANTHHDFILYVLPLLKMDKVVKNDLLFSKGDYIEEMFIVSKGCLSLVFELNLKEIEIGRVREKFHFGEIFLYYNIQSLVSLKGKSKISEIFILKKNDFMNIKNLFHFNIVQILKESYSFMESVIKKKQLVINLVNDYDVQIDQIQKKLHFLNSLFLIIGFHNYFYKDIDFENPNDFILKHDPLYIAKFLKSIDYRSIQTTMLTENSRKKTDENEKLRTTLKPSLKVKSNISVSPTKNVIIKDSPINQNLVEIRNDNLNTSESFRLRGTLKEKIETSNKELFINKDFKDDDSLSSSEVRKNFRRKKSAILSTKKIENVESSFGSRFENLKRSKSTKNFNQDRNFKSIKPTDHLMKRFQKQFLRPQRELLKEETHLEKRARYLFKFDTKLNKESRKIMPSTNNLIVTRTKTIKNIFSTKMPVALVEDNELYLKFLKIRRKENLRNLTVEKNFEITIHGETKVNEKDKNDQKCGLGNIVLDSFNKSIDVSKLQNFDFDQKKINLNFYQTEINVNQINNTDNTNNTFEISHILKSDEKLQKILEMISRKISKQNIDLTSLK